MLDQRPTPIVVASAPWASSNSTIARLPWAAAPRSALASPARRFGDLVKKDWQRCRLAAGDRVIDGRDAEDVDRRIGRLGQAGIGRGARRERTEIADEGRGKDILAGTARDDPPIDP